MSRGGRGGRGGGGARGGRGGGGMGSGGGVFAFDELEPDYSVTELFPPQPPPVQSSSTKEERAIIARFRSYREKIHNGPMYTVMTRKRGMEDPFNDVSKYSQKYKKQRRKVPQLDARPYVHEFFPAELYSILGVELEQSNGKKKAPKKLTFSALDTLDPLGDLADGSDAEGENGIEGADGESGEKKKGGLLQGLLGDGDGGDDDEDEEQEPEEEIEDDFGDDEEGDYNAEQYFDDGDDAGGDWGDEGGGGEDYY